MRNNFLQVEQTNWLVIQYQLFTFEKIHTALHSGCISIFITHMHVTAINGNWEPGFERLWAG